MCLTDFIEFKKIKKPSPLIGYRTWRSKIDSNELMSEHMDYIWKPDIENVSHEVLESNSGIYAYNNSYYNNYYYYSYNNNYYYNYYNNNYYNYYNNYYLAGIIEQHGRTAIHKDGQRSEYTKVKTLFTIRLADTKGPKEFLDWIGKFNNQVENLAKIYGANTIYWQDFRDSQDLANSTKET